MKTRSQVTCITGIVRIYFNIKYKLLNKFDIVFNFQKKDIMQERHVAQFGCSLWLYEAKTFSSPSSVLTSFLSASPLTLSSWNCDSSVIKEFLSSLFYVHISPIFCQALIIFKNFFNFSSNNNLLSPVTLLKCVKAFSGNSSKLLKFLISSNYIGLNQKVFCLNFSQFSSNFSPFLPNYYFKIFLLKSILIVHIF